MKIFNFGSLNVDRVYQVENFVRAGETISAGKLDFFPGGKGLNQTIAAARAGAEVFHAGCIGNDGAILKECLMENQVPLDYICELPEDGGHTALQVNEKGQNAIIVYPGTNHKLTKEFVDMVMEQVSVGDYVLMQNEINQVPYIMKRAKEAGAVVVLNPSPITPELLEYPLEMVDIFILNEIEGNCLTGETESKRILDALEETYPQAQLLLTLGGDGSCYKFKDHCVKQEIYPNDTVDTTAAGDTFCGYFLAELTNNNTIEEALKHASAAASIAVSRAGAATSIPTKEEVSAFMRKRDR